MALTGSSLKKELFNLTKDIDEIELVLGSNNVYFDKETNQVITEESIEQRLQNIEDLKKELEGKNKLISTTLDLGKIYN